MARHIRSRFRLLAAATVAIAIVVGAALPFGAEAAPQAALGELAPLSPAQADLVVDVVDRFETAGLALDRTPVVSFHTDKADCAHNLGFWRDEAGVDRIRVCWTNPDPVVQATLQTQALVHELAHAWVHRNVTDDARDAFMELVGVDAWADTDVDWTDRGTEVAAELITLAVLDPAVSFIDFDGASCPDWTAAYEGLTGLTAPAQVVSACAA